MAPLISVITMGKEKAKLATNKNGKAMQINFVSLFIGN
jgi:hypothetical protein